MNCDYVWSTIYEVYSTIKKLQHYRKVSVLVQPWDVEIRPCTSGSSNECQQRASRSSELQFLPSITSISRSLFANSRALTKSFSSVVFLVQLPRQFGLTGRKAAWRSEISSRYKEKKYPLAPRVTRMGSKLRIHNQFKLHYKSKPFVEESCKRTSCAKFVLLPLTVRASIPWSGLNHVSQTASWRSKGVDAEEENRIVCLRYKVALLYGFSSGKLVSSDFTQRHLFVAVQTIAHWHTLKITDAIGFCITTAGPCSSKNNDSKSFYGYVMVNCIYKGTIL